MLGLVTFIFFFITQGWIHVGQDDFLETVGFILYKAGLWRGLFGIWILKNMVNQDLDTKLGQDLSNLLLSDWIFKGLRTVSYTHLTLPTIYSV